MEFFRPTRNLPLKTDKLSKSSFCFFIRIFEPRSTISFKKCSSGNSFNYTKLAELSGIENIVHVHGDLDKYYNYATRVGANLPDSKDTPEKEIENLKNLITKILSFDKNLINLPSLVPPLPFKPMLTLESVNNYYKFYEHMQNNKTDICLVVGYSYSDVDSHLNMILGSIKEK